MTLTVPTVAIGAFIFLGPLPLADPTLSKFNAARVVGAPTGRFSGQNAIAFRTSLAQLGQDDIQRIRTRLQTRARLRQPGIGQAIEAGMVGGDAFIVELPPQGEPLTERIARLGKIKPADAVRLTKYIANALDQANVTHGQISSSLIWTKELAEPTITGFCFSEPAPGADAIGLSSLLFEMLSGKPFDAAAFPPTSVARDERVRECLPNITARLAGVVAQGTRGVFSTRADLIAAIDQAIADSVSVLADAAHQSISIKDLSSAAMFLDLAKSYDPDHPAITLVGARLAGGETDPAAAIATAPPLAPEPGLDLTSDQARFLASLKAATPAPRPVAKQKMPWIPMMAGMFGMMVIVVVILVIFLQSS